MDRVADCITEHVTSAAEFEIENELAVLAMQSPQCMCSVTSVALTSCCQSSHGFQICRLVSNLEPLIRSCAIYVELYAG